MFYFEHNPFFIEQFNKKFTNFTLNRKYIFHTQVHTRITFLTMFNLKCDRFYFPNALTEYVTFSVRPHTKHAVPPR